jgi:23S rRNA pseudouridine1911/1915/1917 synthase
MSTPDSETWVITAEEAGERLDKILAQRYLQQYSRTYFQYLIGEHLVLLNGIPVKKRTKPEEGDEVDILFSATPEIDVAPESIPLDILYEDDAIIVINKPAGMVVHPAPGNWTGTFVNALLGHCKALEVPEGSLRPGIVHRLDKDTSGVLIAAKTLLAQQRLIELFAGRRVYKEYLAICCGNPGTGEIDIPIGRHPVHRQKMAPLKEGGKPALTRYDTLSFDGALSVVRIILATGRTHQIRVHMLHLGTPVLGDAIYGQPSFNKKFKAERQLLHAYRLRLPHPLTGKMMEFEAPIPTDIQKII